MIFNFDAEDNAAAAAALIVYGVYKSRDKNKLSPKLHSSSLVSSHFSIADLKAHGSVAHMLKEANHEQVIKNYTAKRLL